LPFRITDEAGSEPDHLADDGAIISENSRNEQREAIKYNQLEATFMIFHSFRSPEA
jgi:hypothetical protein